jgi:hypothetical protein
MSRGNLSNRPSHQPPHIGFVVLRNPPYLFSTSPFKPLANLNNFTFFPDANKPNSLIVSPSLCRGARQRLAAGHVRDGRAEDPLQLILVLLLADEHSLHW